MQYLKLPGDEKCCVPFFSPPPCLDSAFDGGSGETRDRDRGKDRAGEIDSKRGRERGERENDREGKGGREKKEIGIMKDLPSSMSIRMSSGGKTNTAV